MKVVLPKDKKWGIYLEFGETSSMGGELTDLRKKKLIQRLALKGFKGSYRLDDELNEGYVNLERVTQLKMWEIFEEDIS